ncbi:unnamed protein product [Cylindrotheca closterium]|uniref:Uncharacterized protein n=1 Tax=Cylindrotheca closterium TaxID=2856 RepID=A0AAD2CP55_9STRA|nr:unnamed protein product [Cylindrotheca closterium]
MVGINRLSASFIALSAWQTLSGGVVATAAASPSAADNCFQKCAFYPRKHHGAATRPASQFHNLANIALDEYEYLERTVMDCTNDSTHEEETDSEARFAYQLDNEREFLRRCESSYLLRDVQQSETKVVPSSSFYHYRYGNDITEV